MDQYLRLQYLVSISSGMLKNSEEMVYVEG